MTRIIPRLDVKGGNLIKGIHLEGLRVLGKPEVYAQAYYHAGADELLLVDSVASLYGRNGMLDVVQRVATDVFIPICVGGGIRSIEDIRQALRAGADKVLINTAAHRRPGFISDAAEIFGSSTIVVAVEAIMAGGSYAAVTDNGRELTGRAAIAWASEAASLGAGEIVATSVDREGTGRGFDRILSAEIRAAVDVPVVAHGGFGRPSDAAGMAVSGLAIASALHYRQAQQLEVDPADYPEGNVDFLLNRRRQGFDLVQPCTIDDVRAGLVDLDAKEGTRAAC